MTAQTCNSLDRRLAVARAELDLAIAIRRHQVHTNRQGALSKAINHTFLQNLTEHGTKSVASKTADRDARPVEHPDHVELGSDNTHHRGETGDSSGELHDRFALKIGVIHERLTDLSDTAEHLLKVVEKLRVDFHKLAPSSLVGTESVERSPAATATVAGDRADGAS